MFNPCRAQVSGFPDIEELELQLQNLRNYEQNMQHQRHLPVDDDNDIANEVLNVGYKTNDAVYESQKQQSVFDDARRTQVHQRIQSPDLKKSIQFQNQQLQLEHEQKYLQQIVGSVLKEKDNLDASRLLSMQQHAVDKMMVAEEQLALLPPPKTKEQLDFQARESELELKVSKLKIDKKYEKQKSAQKLQQFEVLIAKLQNENAKLNQQIAEFRKVNIGAQLLLEQENQSKLQVIKEQMKDYTQEIHLKYQQLAEQKALFHENQIKNYQSQLNKLRKELLDNQKSTKASDLSPEAVLLRQLQDEVGDKEQVYLLLNNENIAVKEANSQLKQQNLKLISERDDVRKENESLQRVLLTLQQEKSQYQLAYSQKVTAVTVQEPIQLNRIHGQLSRLMQQIGTNTSRINSLEYQFKSFKNQAIRYQLMNKMLVKFNESAQTVSAKIKRFASVRCLNLQDFEKQKLQFQADLDSILMKRQSIKTQTSSYNDLVNQLQQQSSNVQNQFSNVDKKIVELTQKIDGIRIEKVFQAPSVPKKSVFGFLTRRKSQDKSNRDSISQADHKEKLTESQVSIFDHMSKKDSEVSENRREVVQPNFQRNSQSSGDQKPFNKRLSMQEETSDFIPTSAKPIIPSTKGCRNSMEDDIMDVKQYKQMLNIERTGKMSLTADDDQFLLLQHSSNNTSFNQRRSFGGSRGDPPKPKNTNTIQEILKKHTLQGDEDSHDMALIALESFTQHYNGHLKFEANSQNVAPMLMTAKTLFNRYNSLLKPFSTRLLPSLLAIQQFAMQQFQGKHALELLLATLDVPEISVFGKQELFDVINCVDQNSFSRAVCIKLLRCWSAKTEEQFFDYINMKSFTVRDEMALVDYMVPFTPKLEQQVIFKLTDVTKCSQQLLHVFIALRFLGFRIDQLVYQSIKTQPLVMNQFASNFTGFDAMNDNYCCMAPLQTSDGAQKLKVEVFSDLSHRKPGESIEVRKSRGSRVSDAYLSVAQQLSLDIKQDPQ